LPDRSFGHEFVALGSYVYMMKDIPVDEKTKQMLDMVSWQAFY